MSEKMQKMQIVQKRSLNYTTANITDFGDDRGFLILSVQCRSTKECGMLFLVCDLRLFAYICLVTIHTTI